MDKITIDRKALFTLASDTRIELLRNLDRKRMTLSELSKELKISKAAVKEHIDKLIDAGLIRRIDEGRKWVYYELTGKGKHILRPESKAKIVFMLSSALASITGGLFELYRFLSLSKLPAPAPTPETTPTPMETPAPIPTTPATSPTPSITPTPTAPPVPPTTTPITPEVEQIMPEIHLMISIILILFGIAILIYYLKK